MIQIPVSLVGAAPRERGINIFIYIIVLYVTELFLNGWTDLNEMFCVHLGNAMDGLDS